ncbi:MAG TPA: GNAT family N-acetyltransferase [Gaiellales bacterium]|nr:GNAT family N-acetyltransferase [Gaiellales bacterium]
MSRIRVARLRDLAACYRIAGHLSNEPPTRLEEDLRATDRLLLVAERGGTIIGYGRAALWRVDPDDGRGGYYLVGVGVRPDHHRQGIALALTEARMRWIAGRADEAWYFTNARNAASIALHGRFGFQEMARAPSFRGVPFSGGEGILYRAWLRAAARSAGSGADASTGSPVQGWGKPSSAA